MIKLGLERIAGLLVQLSKPTWLAVHIAGTNGKGSVASYLSALFLRLSRPNTTGGELRIGKFTSPHLIDRWDCITINDQPVSQSLFLAVEQHVKSAAVKLETQLDAEGKTGDEGKVSQFELLTATAFEIFSRQKCQLAVVECGLGGRLDATNALPSENVAVSVITKIGLDHQSFLGTTASEIATEKAGIIRTGIPIVIDGTNTPEVKTAISRIAREKGAEFLQTTEDESQDVDIPSDIPLHQQQNLKVALIAFSQAIPRVHTLEIQPLNTKPDIIERVLSDVAISYPGRLQTISISSIIPEYTSPILLDGAHNAQSATVLREYVDRQLIRLRKRLNITTSANSTTVFRNEEQEEEEPNVRVTWIIAMSQGKDAHQILRILLGSSPPQTNNDSNNQRKGEEGETEQEVLCCNFSPVAGMPWVRSMEPSELAQVARSYIPDINSNGTKDNDNVTCHDNIVEALRHACLGRNNIKDNQSGINEYVDLKNPTKEKRLIVVAGSLYLVSDLLRELRRASSQS